MIASTLPAFVAITVVLSGGAGFLAGQALAARWRPAWMAVGYSLLLGLANRGLVYALIGRDLLSLAGYAVDTTVIVAFCLVGFRLTQVRMMTTQYPWLYVRATPWSYRVRPGGGRDAKV